MHLISIVQQVHLINNLNRLKYIIIGYIINHYINKEHFKFSQSLALGSNFEESDEFKEIIDNNSALVKIYDDYYI